MKGKLQLLETRIYACTMFSSHNRPIKKDLLSYRFALLTFLYFSFFGLMQLSNWPILRVWNIRGQADFQDLRAILRWSDCFSKVGWDIYEETLPINCSNYSYGSSLIRLLHLFHIGESLTNPIGWILLTAMSILFAIITLEYCSRFGNRSFFPFLVLCSPPILLLLERGNLDSLIFIGLFLALLLHRKEHQLTAFFLLYLITAFKFYTFPVLILYVMSQKILRNKIFMGFSGIALLILTIYDLGRIKSIFFPDWYAAFGVSVWGKYINHLLFSFSNMQSLALGWGILTIAIVFLHFFPKIVDSLAPLPTEIRNRSVCISSGHLIYLTVFLSCYTAGLNYDYRIIFLIFGALIYLQSVPSSISKYFKILMLLTVWFSFNAGVFQPLGDVFMLILVSAIAVQATKFSYARIVTFKTLKVKDVPLAAFLQ